MILNQFICLLFSPITVLSHILFNAFRSSCFITAFCCGSITGAVLCRTAKQIDDGWLGFAGGAVSGLSLLIEKQVFLSCCIPLVHLLVSPYRVTCVYDATSFRSSVQVCCEPWMDKYVVNILVILVIW